MSEKIKWYERSPNNTSAMRIALIMCVITGIIGFLTTLILTITMFITGKWEAIPILVAIVSASGGIMAVGDIAKSIQVKAEK